MSVPSPHTPGGHSGRPAVEEPAVQESFSVNDILNGKGPKVNEHHNGRHNAYMAHKISKLGDQNQASADSAVSSIFQGCAIFVNGYTDPPVNELKRIIAVNGGKFNQYETSDTTHFACNHYPQTKLDRLKKGLEKRKIYYVTIKWILDSVSEGRRLREAGYRPGGLYDASSHTLSDVGGVMLSGGKRKLPEVCVDAMSALASLKASGTHSPAPAQDMNTSSLAVAESVPSAAHACSSGATAGAEPLRGALSNPRNAENDPKFIEHFFESSRLHFIGTWRSRLPALYEECVAAAAPPLDLGGVSAQGLSSAGDGSRSRVVLHVDMDCFFVSVLLRNRPELAASPVAVAHSKSSSQGGYSEISSCNYPARACGLKNGMFMHQAVKLCPHLQVLPYDFAQYSAVSEQVYRIMFATTLLGATVQPLSVDEAYIELPPGSDGHSAGRALREQIRRQTGCAASVGVGDSMLTARLATKSAKPDGIFVLAPEMLAAHMSGMPLRDLPGVGHKHAKVLKEKGLAECKDVWPIPQSILESWLGGSLGAMVYNYSRGMDDRALKPVVARKSVGVDINYGIRFSTARAAEEFLRKLSEELASRLRQAGSWGRTVTLKVMVRRWEASAETSKFLGHGVCDSKSRSTTLPSPVCEASAIAAAVLGIFQPLVRELAERALPLMRSAQRSTDDAAATLSEAAGQVVQDLRGIGIQISRLSPLGSLSDGRGSDGVADAAGAANSILQYVHSGKAKPPNAPTAVASLLSPAAEAEAALWGADSGEEEDLLSDDERVAVVDRPPPTPPVAGGRPPSGAAASTPNACRTATAGPRPHRTPLSGAGGDRGPFDGDYVTSSQFDFLMSVAEGAPELLSQVKQQMAAAAAQRDRAAPEPSVSAAQTHARALTAPAPASAPASTAAAAGGKHTARRGPAAAAVSLRWPREPMASVQSSLVEWVRFAELLEGESARRHGAAEAGQVRSAFPSGEMIAALSDYGAELVRTKQAEQAVLFAKLVSHTFRGRGARFDEAAESVRAAVEAAGRAHCFGALQI